MRQNTSDATYQRCDTGKADNAAFHSFQTRLAAFVIERKKMQDTVQSFKIMILKLGDCGVPENPKN